MIHIIAQDYKGKFVVDNYFIGVREKNNADGISIVEDTENKSNKEYCIFGENISSAQMVPYLLGRYNNLEDAENIIKQIAKVEEFGLKGKLEKFYIMPKRNKEERLVEALFGGNHEEK